VTEARVKGEGWNKVKLRGQKIPGINMARKVSFLRDNFHIQRERKGNRKRKKNQFSTSTESSPGKCTCSARQAIQF